MTAERFLQYVTWALFLVIFAASVRHAIRHPRAANLDIALLFGAPALIISVLIAVEAGLVESGRLTSAINVTLLLALGYLLVRLVDDLASVPAWLQHGAAGGFVVLSAAAFALAPPRPLWYTLLIVPFFVGLQAYAGAAFVRASRATRGVTRRRMEAAAAGSALIGLVVIVAALRPFLPELAGLLSMLSSVAALGSGLAYFLAFTPPAWVRRAWQEPELRAFLGRAATLPRLPHTQAIVQEFERGAAASVGAPHAAIGLWDETAGVLRFALDLPPPPEAAPLLQRRLGEENKPAIGIPPGVTPAGRAFATQRPLFVPDLHADRARDGAQYDALYQAYGTRAVLAAPITAGSAGSACWSSTRRERRFSSKTIWRSSSCWPTRQP
ncbi:MAG: hypothetical protein HY332_04410 [Chloroflexi bacterium]|nr:hypothetical protein [Chloroflexota bacterium]